MKEGNTEKTRMGNFPSALHCGSNADWSCSRPFTTMVGATQRAMVLTEDTEQMHRINLSPG